jgi:predicted TIM-barrel fold metal-dependent hydrolase
MQPFIIDAVAHAYNQRKDNYIKPLNTINGAYSYHKISTPPAYQLTEEQWARDWDPESFIDMMLLESTTDMICMHSVPQFEFLRTPIVTNEKGAYLKKHYPDRVHWYAALDVGDRQDRVLAKLEEVVAQGADGIKLYPTGVNAETGQATDWFMSDTEVAFPIFDRIRAHGIKQVAIHKLLEYDGLTGKKQRAYGINDVAVAAKAYPDLNFHLVHAGWLLMEDTILLMQEHQNVIAVLEGPMFWPIIDPKRFDLFMSRFMNSVGSDRMLYSSAATNPHPRFMIEAFANYKPPAGADFTLTDQDKVSIFGLNFARIHNIDIDNMRRKFENDRFSKYKAENGLRRPWGGIV